MNFNKTITNWFNKFIMPAKLSIDPITLGGIFAGGGAIGGALIGKDAAKDAAAASQFAPVNITSGTGSTTYVDPIQANLGMGTKMLEAHMGLQDGSLTQEQFDAMIAEAQQTGESGGFTAQLSPELQVQRDRLMQIGQEGLDTFQGFDPTQAAAQFTQQLDTIAAPQEEKARLSLENRLFKQGLTQSTPGADRFGALATAQGMAQNQRNLQGMQFGTGEQQRLFQNALGGIQGATALDALSSQQLNQAISAGGANTSANITGANFNFQAGQNNADALSGFFGGIGQGFMNMSQPTSTFGNNNFGSGGMDVNAFINNPNL